MDVPSFLEDIYPKNLLYAVTIRSPAAKGKLKSINIQLPDNYTLITAKDIPGENKLENTSMPVLAYDKVSYIGEPVAIILGHEKTKLEELVSRCFVDIEEESPVFSCADENCETEEMREIKTGNTELTGENLKKITGRYSTGIQEHWYAEPVGAITWYTGDKKTEKKLIIKTATQWPYHVKRAVSCMLNEEPSNINVEPTALNLHMDGKLWYPSLVACHAALGTYMTKKPVRLILKRDEDFLFSPCSS